MKRTADQLSPDSAGSAAALPKRPPSEENLKEKYEKTCEMYRTMQHCAAKLGLPQLVVATGMVYFHKFFLQHSWRSCDPLVVAAAALFLACKAESTPRRLREMAAAFFRLAEGHEPYEKCRADIADAELKLIQVLDFDFTVHHPYALYVQRFDAGLRGTKDWRQLGWLLLNDSYNTSICVKYSAEQLAHAAIRIAAGGVELSASLDKDWARYVPVAAEVVERVHRSLLNYYHFSKNAHLIAVLTKKEKFAAKPLPTGSRAAPDPAPAPAGAAAAAAAAASTANGTATAAPG